MAALFVLFGMAMAPIAAKAETRSLKLYHLHTHEKAEIVYKRNGRYLPDGLKKINYILRDWRRDETVKMDPRLLDLVWEAYRESGATGYIQVVCGYRAPATNAMLRSRSRGVAQKSQHMLGKAMDFFIPGVPLKKLRDIGLKMQGGGVGYYPRSGSPFVHMDVGNVRHWPGISRQELVRVFPNGKTLHVPSDGRPLPGYEQALASYKSRKANGTPNIELASAGGGFKRSGGFLASLFGGGADEAEDEADVASDDAPAPKKTIKPTTVVTARAATLPGIAIVSPDKAKRADIPMIADAADEASPEEARETPETIIAALPVRSIPLPAFAPRPKADVGPETPETVPFGMADASEDAAATPTATIQMASAETPASMPFGMAEMAAADVSADPVQAAVNAVPLPTWRPDPSAKPAELATGDQSAVLLALADAADRGNAASDALAVLPSARPDEIGDLVKKASTDDYQVASLSPMPPRSVFSDPHGIDAATPREAVARRPAGSDPVAAIGGNVKTTRKEGRATAQDASPGPKSVTVAAQPELARWALHGDEAAAPEESTEAPQLAYNMVRTAPSEAYTMGFQTGDETADANRFTGSAVTFLPVAKFAK
jgi:uncharacterized protein YcbK (DUF882 family)